MNAQMAPMRRHRRPVPGSAAFDQSNPFIYLGTVSGARKAKARAGSLVAPLDLDAEIVAWPVKDLDVLLVTEPDYAVEAARLAGVLIRDGAKKVVIVDGTRSAARVHRAADSTVIAPAERRATVDAGPNFD